MKSRTNLISVLTFVLVTCCRLNAQYVTIPDANFVTKLQQLFPGAMNGNQMDTTHAQVVNCTNLNLSSLSIQSIDGIQYFDALEMLNCDQNDLTSLPPLPSSLEFLHCSSNQLTSLPQLNQTALIQLHCSGNQLSSLPTLPASLTMLFCSSNPLTYLPNLPSSLLILESQSCQLFSLPNLPIGLIELWCASNQLTSLPTLPALNILCCANNSISCLPIIPSSIDFFPGFDLSLAIIDGNPLSCIPNETPYFNSLTTGLPLCLPYDPITNPNNCETSVTIYGRVYDDQNANCLKDLAENGLQQVPILLKDNTSGAIVTQIYSSASGFYNSFTPLDGDYTITIDTLPLATFAEPTCADSSFIVAAGQTISNLDLGIRCNGGFDFGIQSVVEESIVFPGLSHTLRVIAGDLSTYYGLLCPNSVQTGQVQVTVTGPVTYTGVPATALLPFVNGNIYTYDIADFSAVNVLQSFALNFTTDTTAQSGDTISVYVTLTTTQAGDGDLSNNTFTNSYLVVNSYDPNMKEVYPVDVLPGYDDYFTYTIHFQNMGSAPAINIRLADTLDSHLDLSTFELLSSSHNSEMQLVGNKFYVRFPNINLVSNTVDEEASKGYIQYRVKPYPNQPNGTVIPNTAYIYFDYNPAVITNTTENHFWEDLSVPATATQPIFHLYPNPNNGKFTIQTEQSELGSVLRIVDVSGKTVLQTQLMATTQAVTGELEAGVYVVSMENPLTGIVAQKRLVVHK